MQRRACEELDRASGAGIYSQARSSCGQHHITHDDRHQFMAQNCSKQSVPHTHCESFSGSALSSVPIHTQHPSSLVQTHAYSRLGGSCVSFGMLAGFNARIRLAGMAFSFWPSSDSIGGVIVRVTVTPLRNFTLVKSLVKGL